MRKVGFARPFLLFKTLFSRGLLMAPKSKDTLFKSGGNASGRSKSDAEPGFRGVVDAETIEREKKTARLRKLRLEKEAAEELLPKPEKIKGKTQK